MPRGVDHGLGGRESENSKRKRAKRAHRIKTQAESRMKVINGKKEVVFDEQARVDYLTGFRKRKNERRKYGLAMRLIKETKDRKEALKQRRSDVLKANNLERQKLMERGGNLLKSGDSSEEDEEKNKEKSENVEESDSENDSAGDLNDGGPQESLFTDDNTTSMFGGSVSVVISSDISTENEKSTGNRTNNRGADKDDEEELRLAKQRLDKKREAKLGKPLTKLERALKKVTSSGGLLKKRKTSSSKGSKDSLSRNKAKGENSAAGKALLHKAMGAGIVGGFKGKTGKKGRRQ